MQTHLQDLKQRQAVLRILIFTLVTAMIWIGISIFRTQHQTETSSELLKLAQPINPNLDLEVVSRVEQKRGYQAEELQDFPLYIYVANDQGIKTLVTDSPSSPYQAPATPPPRSTQSTFSESDTATDPATTQIGQPTPAPESPPSPQASPDLGAASPSPVGQ